MLRKTKIVFLDRIFLYLNVLWCSNHLVAIEKQPNVVKILFNYVLEKTLENPPGN